MIITCTDYTKYVDVGSSDNLYSLYSTICVCLSRHKRSLRLLSRFIEKGSCAASKCLDTAAEFKLAFDLLSQLPPDEAVYDKNDISRPAPWSGNISSDVKSCADLYTTADGENLILEIVSLLEYAAVSKANVFFE